MYFRHSDQWNETTWIYFLVQEQLYYGQRDWLLSIWLEVIQ